MRITGTEKCYYKESYPIGLKDDSGEEFFLTLVEKHSKEYEGEIQESPYRYWIVLSKNKRSYVAYWKALKKELLKVVINNFVIEEVEDGKHCVFDEQYFNPNTEMVSGLRTKFKLTKCE